MKAIWSKLLKIHAFRRALLAHLRLDYFHEFHHSIPLGNNYWAHLLEEDSYDSFSEIFIKQEYLKFIPKEPISCILDIGAHYGYFSLWLQSIHPEIKLRSLLVEPSPRCTHSLEKSGKPKETWGHILLLARSHWLTEYTNDSILRPITHGWFQIFFFKIGKSNSKFE